MSAVGTPQANTGAIPTSDTPDDATAQPSPDRYIESPTYGQIVADVTVEEEGHDSVTITRHPVEKKAAITDHAYSEPAELALRLGWSPSGSGQEGGDPTPLETIYSQLLAIKDLRELLTVQTGKRLYENMLIQTVVLVTDAETENALFIAMRLMFINLVETQTVTVPPNNVQKSPEKTGNVYNAGAKNAQPNPPSYNGSAPWTVTR